MATQAELDSRFQRLIAETGASGAVYDASLRLLYLNQAYYLAQERIMEVAPEEYLWSSTASIVALQQKYQRPLVENVRRYQYLSGTVFRDLNLLPPEMVTLSTSTTPSAMPSEPGYCIDGPEFILSWLPDTTVTLGLRVSYHDVIVLVGSTDVPRMPTALHHLLAYGAAIQALEETKDAAEEVVDRYRRRWASVFGPEDGSTDESRKALRKYYRVSQARPITGQNLGCR